MFRLENTVKKVLFIGSVMLICCLGTRVPAEEAGTDLLLVIDMQNAYTSDGPWTCPHIEQAADQIETLIQSGHFHDILFYSFRCA